MADRARADDTGNIQTRMGEGAMTHEAGDARKLLQELVACKDLKERAEDLIESFGGTCRTPEESTAYCAVRNEYLRRKPLAWATARAYLAQPVAQPVGVPREPTLEMIAAYMAQPFASPDESSEEFIARHWRAMYDAAPAQAEPREPTVEQLREGLRDANSLCRSMYQIAARDGAETNWDAFRRRLQESLLRQHRIMYPAAPAAPAAPEGDIDALTHSLQSIVASNAVRADIRNTIRQAADAIAALRARAERAEEMEQFRNDQALRLTNRAERAEADGRIDGLEAAVYAIDSESVLGGTKREHMAAVNMRDGLARKVRFLLQNARAAIDRARSQGEGTTE